MKLSRILGLLAVLLVLPITLAFQDGGLRPTVANAECQVTVGDCCFRFGRVCRGGPIPIYDHYYNPNGCGKP